MSQSTLTEEAPLVLDSTCSYGKIWPQFASIRMDVRPETKPDIVADAKYLPFRPGVFDMIYCDPPHLITGPGQGLREARRRKGRNSFDMFTRYSWWNTRQDWLDFALESGKEFTRTLKSSGQLLYKITECRGMKLDDLDVIPLNLVKDRRVRSRSNLFPNFVHYLTYAVKR